MPKVTLQPDSDDEHVCLALDGKRLVPLRVGDQEGLKIILTLLVENGAISAEDAATVQGMTPRTNEDPWQGKSRRLSRSVGGFVLSFVHLKSHLHQPHRWLFAMRQPS